MAVLETAAAFKCAAVTAGTCTCLLRSLCRASISSFISPSRWFCRDAFAVACQGTHSARPQLAVT
eukprot:scaffold133293_cov77-Phaeocystis_antarctica.AAC.2